MNPATEIDRLLARLEREFEYEAQHENPPVDPQVQQVCAQARRLSVAIRDAKSAWRARQWLDSTSRDWLPRARGTLDTHNLDILTGCLFGLDSAIRRVTSTFAPKRVRKMRHVVRRRLNL